MQSDWLLGASLSVALVLIACQPSPNAETARVADTSGARPADTMAAGHDMTTPRSTGDPKIDDALSAAPAAVAQNATVMDWPDSAGKQKELRRGTNGWTCFPSTPAATGAAGRDPMCLDKEFVGWVGALVSRKPPQVKGVGIGYMLHGDMGASNTDPFAKGPTADNQWVKAGPHLMLITPTKAQLENVPTDPKNGGPWVMWKGTPYAHVMVPTQ
jgi:hypothetical protein